ncbi:MAG: hypothetical protein ACT4PV_12790 [Planctomycetaceae bacterium]
MSIPSKLAEALGIFGARLALLAGLRARARASLKQVLRRNPVSFTARFLLGRVYLADMSLGKAKREFDLAWQIAPERFEIWYARLRERYQGAGELFAAYGGLAGLVQERGDEVGPDLGDFRDEEEYRHFASLPPITRDEIEDMDWDRFQDEIFKDFDSV